MPSKADSVLGLFFPSSSCVYPSPLWFRSTVSGLTLTSISLYFFTLISLLKVLVDLSGYLINLNFNTLPIFTIFRFCPFSGASNLLFVLGLKILIMSYLPLSATFNLFQSLVPSSFAIFHELVSSSPAPSMFPLWLSYFCLVTGPNLPFGFSLP